MVPGVSQPLWESWVSARWEREGWGTQVWAQPPGTSGFGVGGLTFVLPWGSVTWVVGDLGEIWVCVQSPGAWGQCLGLREGTWPPPGVVGAAFSHSWSPLGVIRTWTA